LEKIAASIAQIAAGSAAMATAEDRAVIVGLPPEVMAALSAWIADRPEPRPSVAQAAGRGLAEWLRGQGYLPQAAETPPGV
jgi:hypothetical protein